MEPYQLPVHEIYPMYEKIEYQIFGGLIVIDFCLNYFNLFGYKLYEYIKPSARYDNLIIISNIFTNSPVDNLNTFSDGEFITKVNNKTVKSVKDFRKALLKPIKIKKKLYTKFENKNNEVIVLSCQELIEYDEYASNIFNFNLTDIHKKLKKLLGKHSD